MKNSYKYMFALLLPAFAGCQESDDVQYHIENPEDQMLITASVEELVLTPDMAEQEVLTFTWNAPADRGEGSEVTSYFRMDIADNNFATATDLIKLEPGQTSISFIGDDLNDYLLGWGISPETTVRVEAEIIASVENPDIYLKPELTKTNLLLTGYSAVSRRLWIVNPAMDEGADDEMNEIVLSKQYSWAGWFEPGTGFKFVYDRATGLPSLNKGDGNNEVVKRNSDSDADNLFTVDQAGYYNVNISTKTMTCTWELQTPKYDAVWMVGNAVPCGWNIDAPDPMTQNADNPWIFEWDGHMNAGELKLPLAVGQGWGGCDYFMPEVNGTDQNGDGTVVVIPGGNPDNKWNITEAGEYHVEVNSFTMKIKFEKKD